MINYSDQDQRAVTPSAQGTALTFYEAWSSGGVIVEFGYEDSSNKYYRSMYLDGLD